MVRLEIVRLIASVAVGSCLALALPTALATAAEGPLALSPRPATPGTTVTAHSDTDFLTAASTCTIEWTGKPQLDGECRTDSDEGVVDATFVVPDRTVAGNYVVTVKADGALVAENALEIVAGLVAEPDEVTAGETIDVSGKGFSYDDECTLRWDSQVGEKETCEIDKLAKLTGTVRVPENAEPGTHTVQAVASGGQSAETSVDVVVGPEVPFVIGMTADEARGEIEAAGLGVCGAASGDFVVEDQNPLAGTRTPKDSCVALTLRSPDEPPPTKTSRPPLAARPAPTKATRPTASVSPTPTLTPTPTPTPTQAQAPVVVSPTPSAGALVPGEESDAEATTSSGDPEAPARRWPWIVLGLAVLLALAAAAVLLYRTARARHRQVFARQVEFRPYPDTAADARLSGGAGGSLPTLTFAPRPAPPPDVTLKEMPR